MKTESAFRNLTSPVRASLEGIAPLSVSWTRRSPLLSVQETVGEVQRGVARSPSWRWLYSGRKSGFPAKCPPSYAVLHRLSEQPGTPVGQTFLRESAQGAIYLPLKPFGGSSPKPDHRTKARVGLTTARAFLFSSMTRSVSRGGGRP
jgi:hypothetical protein